LTKNEWKKVVSAFLIKEKIDKFSLLGFSLGGRFAISTAYEFAEKIEKLTLVAPDGIFKSIWYRLSVSFWFRPVFKILMNKYSLFNSIIDTIESLRIANRSLTNFARKELGEPSNRIKVYRSWVYLVPLGYKMNTLAKKINQNKIPVTFVLGTRDNIVPEKEIKSKTKRFKTAVYFDFPAKHHELLQTHILNQIIS
jgi:pimeloyl-ACP methyl ester carboxylesterase